MKSDYRAYLTSFGNALREARLATGQSQETLALRVGMDRTFVSAAERGRKNPTLVSVIRICEGLEISPATLLANMND